MMIPTPSQTDHHHEPDTPKVPETHAHAPASMPDQDATQAPEHTALADMEQERGAHVPTSAGEDTHVPVFSRLAREGFWGRLVASLAKRARWCATAGGFFEPFHTDALREMRKEGKRVFPLHPLLAWDEHETSEPPRILKNDWRALWMGGLSGRMIQAPAPELLASYAHVDFQDGDACALALDSEGAPMGVAVLFCQNGVWRDREWQSAGPEADRVLLAIVLRFARDGKHSIVLSNAPITLSMERGAFWAWEWVVTPSRGGFWGALAGAAFSWRAKVLGARARKLGRSAAPAP